MGTTLMSAMGRKRTLARLGNERPLTGTGLNPGNDWDGRFSDVQARRQLMAGSGSAAYGDSSMQADLGKWCQRFGFDIVRDKTTMARSRSSHRDE